MPKNTQTGSTSPAADTCRTSSAERPDVLPLPAVPGRQLEKLSIVIPARDEAGCIASTVEHLHLELTLQGIRHEIVVVDDGSRDETYAILEATTARIPNLVPVRSPGPHGFGRAIQRGLDAFSGDAVVIMMADESDDCRDVVRYWRILQEGHDCVFGSRFMKGGGVIDYPRIKYAVNRLANWFVRTLFGIRLNDTTNAFKA
jgi:dolichol-phosphate mannosyltransferase